MSDSKEQPIMWVQVFLTGSEHCEVADQLVGIEFRAPWVSLKTRDADGDETTHHFPVAAVRQIRISEIKES